MQGVEVEQRRSPRVTTPGLEALCGAGSSAGRYNVQNLSHGGVLLRGTVLFSVGEAVDLVLLPPERPIIEAKGHVVRHHPPGGREGLGIAFRSMSRESEDAILVTIADAMLRTSSQGALSAEGADAPS